MGEAIVFYATLGPSPLWVKMTFWDAPVNSKYTHVFSSHFNKKYTYFDCLISYSVNQSTGY